MNPNYENKLNAAAEKMKFAAQAQCEQAIGGDAQAYQPRRTQREEAEKNMGFHMEQADKAARAATFFREHPEFDEFIHLVRSGAIGI